MVWPDAAQPPIPEAGCPKAMAPPGPFSAIPDICWFIWSGREEVSVETTGETPLETPV